MIDFGRAEEMHYVSKTHTIDHVVNVDGTRVNCRVSTEYLSDQFGMTDGANLLSFAQSHFAALSEEWRNLITIGAIADDNSVLLRSI